VFPCWKEVPLMGEEQRPQPTATEADYRAARRKASTVRDGAIIELLWSCGRRRGELVRLDVEDVNLSDGLLVVRQSKTGRPRVVPLSRSARRAVRRQIAGRPSGSLLGMSSNAIRLLLKRLGAPSVHAWRRGWAVEALRNGVSEASVRSAAGWSLGAMAASVYTGAFWRADLSYSQVVENKLLLSASGLSKVYPPAVQALSDCEFTLAEGEIHGVIGVNGAGKSTLVKILAGVVTPTSGTISMAGFGDVRLSSPADAHRYGIGVVHQELPLFENLTVAENLFVGVEEQELWRVAERRKATARYEQIAEDFLGAPDPRRLIGELTIDKRQIVSIVRALACGARILILDEATSSLPAEERTSLHDNLHRVAAGGIGIVYVSHFIEDVMSVCDRVSVIRDGRNVVSKFRNEIGSSGELIEDMTGQPLVVRDESDTGGHGLADQRVVVSLRGFATDQVQPLDLDVSRGECVGLYGLEGCGAREVLHGAFGLDRHSGDVIVNGDTVSGGTVRRMRAGLALVSGDRRRTLLVEDTVRANFDLPEFARQNLSRRAKSNERVATITIQQFAVKGHLQQKLNTLSGGNQQKLALGRWLHPLPVCLLADEPTRGIDVEGRAAIHHYLRRLLADGLSIVLNSTDPEELVAVADRVIILADGAVVRELAHEEITVSEIEHSARTRDANRPTVLA
jgi:ribose transport system ATP-binding protein